MSDGTAPVHKARHPANCGCGKAHGDATSVTLDEQQATVIYSAWTIVDGNAYRYSSHTSRVKAYRVAETINGVVTKEAIVADFSAR